LRIWEQSAGVKVGCSSWEFHFL